MAYIGLVPQQTLLSTFSETFSGDGSTLQFNLSRSVSKASDLEVFIGNTQQLPTAAYTANGTQLLFVSAPTAGSNNVTVIYRAGALQTVNVTNASFNQGTAVAPAVNAAVATSTGIYWPTSTDLGISANGALRLAINSTAASSSTSTGAAVIYGGMGVSGNVNAGGNVNISSSTASTSSTTGALVVSGGVGIGGKVFITDDLQVAGDFTVNGTFTTTASDSLAITDPFVFLAANNAGDALDQGFVGKYVDGGSTTRYHGIFRDVTDGSYQLFTNLTNQPTTVVDTANASYNFANLTLGVLTSSNISAGNIRITANTISSTNTNGNIDISPDGSGSINLNDPVVGSSTIQATRFISNIATGTAPLVVTSTTAVANLNVTGSQTGITATGTLTQLTVSNSILPSANITYDIGSTSARWSTLYGLSTSAQYADLAENYQADAEYEPGTVVSFGGIEEITLSTVDHDVKIAGVITTNPAHLMNSGLEGKNVAAVGLTGRLPCKVTGLVTKGDMMVSAGNGRARAESNPKIGSVLGKALQEHTVDGDGTIEIVVGRV